MLIEITGVAELRASLDGFSDRRFSATLATALTRTAVAARDEMQRQLQAKFDRPTPYTVRSVRYLGATADRLQAHVGFDVQASQDITGAVTGFVRGETPASEYMRTQTEGGPRKTKRLEAALRAAGALPAGWFVVPGQGANLDAYGNVSRGQVVQVLSQLRIQLVAGSSRNMSLSDQRSAIRAQRRAGGRFFVMPVGGKTQPGIYQRELMGRNVTPVFIFVRATTYQQRWDFYADARRFVEPELSRQIGVAVQQQLTRLQARGR